MCKILLQWTKHQRSISLAGFRSQYHFQNDWTLGSLNQYYICLTFQSIQVYSVLALGFLPQVFCFNQLVFLSVCVVHDSHQTDTGDQQRQITLFTQLSSWNLLFKDLNVSSDPKSYHVVPVSHWHTHTKKSKMTMVVNIRASDRIIKLLEYLFWLFEPVCNRERMKYE